MSIDIEIKLKQEIKANQLIAGTQNEFSMLFDLLDNPGLEIKQMIGGILYSVDDDMMLQPSKSYFMSFINTTGQPHERSHGILSPKMSDIA